MYQKQKTCMQIIHQYNVIIGTLAQSGGTAADVQGKILETMPELESILKTINESVSACISGAQSMPPDQLRECVSDSLRSVCDNDNGSLGEVGEYDCESCGFDDECMDG